MAVKLAPVPRQQYVDSSGNPYSGAKLFYYAAGTTTKQNTYTTSVGDVANTNPVVLDSSGRTPYGVWLTTGVNYKVVLAPASDTDPPASPIFTEDVITGINDEAVGSQWAASGVTPTYVSATQFTVTGDKTSTFLVDRRVKCTVTAGTVYGYISVSAYTTLTTVTVVLDSGSLDSGLSAVEVGILTDTNSAIPLTVAKRNAANNYTNAQNEAKGADIASAATINLTTATGNLVHVTGTTTITAITLASGAERTVVFDGVLTLTHNATTLILPGGQNITTAAGDRMIVRGDGSGNARVIAYIPATGYPVNMAKGADIASAATVNLDTATGDFVHITGTTTITAITLASGKKATVVFDGALTLTHNATTLILPGAANITTAGGDRATFRGDGSGNVRCIQYTKADGRAIVSSPSTVVRSARTSNTILAEADRATLIDITSGTFSQTFTAAATLGSGWWCYFRNSGTGEITLDPNGTETIDGLTSFIMYPGETRLIQSDGTNLNSVVITAYRLTMTTTGTYTKPPGYQHHAGLLWGAGGSGAKATAQNGGGGGGGACVPFILPSSSIGATETVTIGAGGASQTVNDSNGNAGGNSTFGSLVTAYGGGAGGANAGGDRSGGSGGGALSAGATGAASSVVGGRPSLVSTSSNDGDNQFGGGLGSTGTKGGSSVYGGGGGAKEGAGGNSLYGGGGGGGTVTAPVTGGTSVFGGAGGAGNTGGPGTDGSAPGGGGGAGKGNSGGDASGAGARGELRIWGVL